jgi:hypothetical protein
MSVSSFLDYVTMINNAGYVIKSRAAGKVKKAGINPP